MTDVRVVFARTMWPVPETPSAPSRGDPLQEDAAGLLMTVPVRIVSVASKADGVVVYLNAGLAAPVREAAVGGELKDAIPHAPVLDGKQPIASTDNVPYRPSLACSCP
jgi:hypothetical protein